MATVLYVEWCLILYELNIPFYYYFFTWIYFQNDLELNPAYDQQPIYEEVGDPVRDGRVQRVFIALAGLLGRCKC